MSDRLLLAAGVLTGVASLRHVAIIVEEPDWYDSSVLAKKAAQMTANGSLMTALSTAGHRKTPSYVVIDCPSCFSLLPASPPELHPQAVQEQDRSHAPAWKRSSRRSSVANWKPMKPCSLDILEHLWSFHSQEAPE